MKNEMRAMNEEKSNLQESKYRSRADRLVEKWAKIPEIGVGLEESFDSNPSKVRQAAVMLENMQNHLSTLDETTISSAFGGLVPENVLRVIRLGYPNSVRGDIFHLYTMQTTDDSIFYLSPTYETSKRGSTAGDITHEKVADRYPSEMEREASTGTVNSTNKVYTLTASNLPLRPGYVRFFDGQNKLIAVDDANGGWVAINPTNDTPSAGSIVYSSGVMTITMENAPATGSGQPVYEYNYDSEASANYNDLGTVTLNLKRYKFEAEPYRLGISWSKMTEFVLDSTLSIDAEEALITGASDLLKSGLDYQAVNLAYSAARTNIATEKTFDTNFLSSGADSPMAHAVTLERVIKDTASEIRTQLNRGGISSLVCGEQAYNYISTYGKMNGSFSDVGKQEPIGIYKGGMYLGYPIFVVADVNVVPTDNIMTVWNNESSRDYSVILGDYLSMYKHPNLEYNTGNTDTGIMSVGDKRVIQSAYLRTIQLDNLSQY